MRFKSFIAILLGLVIMGSACVIALNTIEVQNYLIKKHAETQLKNSADQAALKLSTQLAGCFESIQVLSDTLAQEKETDWNTGRTLAVLKEILAETQFTQINVCGTDGTGFDAEGKIQHTAFCMYYQRALLGDTTIAFTKFYENSAGMDAVFSVPVKQGEKTVGVLRLAFNTTSIRTLLSINTFRGNESIYLVKRNGSILLALTEEQPENENFFELLDEEEASYTELEQVVKQGREILTKAVLAETEQYLSYKGIKDSNDWGVMITIPEKQLIALFQDEQVSGARRLLFIVMCVMTLITALLVFLCAFEILRHHQMERLAYYDEITESINYNRFRKEAAVLFHRQGGGNYAVVQMEIDNFNYIREFFGSQEGDRVRLYIAKVFRDNLKSDELFCRYYTDNFILLLRYHNKEELTNRISFLNSTLCSFEGDEMKNDKYEFQLHYGIYCLAAAESNIEMMIEKATKALNLIKSDKKHIFEYYTDIMQKKDLDDNEIESHMFKALEEKEFLVYLQPKFDLNTGRQVGAEALVRWMHPDKGLLYPGRFIGIFEKNGFIVKLDMYILDELCHRLKIWMSKGYHPMPLSINISRLNLFDENFIEKLIETLEHYGIPSELIMLEMAEEVVSKNINKLSSLMDRLKDYGFMISIDDFGTGTASMNTLYNIQVDELKLDRKFLLEVEKTDRGKNVIQSIIEMARRLDIKVVSEGVENKVQAQMLRELGCDMIQGFAFSEPLPAREYENYAFGPRSNENTIW
jgi:diguanylate cyclase (GGDEF)-like protein